MRAFYDSLNQAGSIFSSKVIILLNNGKNYPEIRRPVIFRCQWYVHQNFKVFVIGCHLLYHSLTFVVPLVVIHCHSMYHPAFFKIIYNDTCITFHYFQNLLIATVYLGFFANLDLSILGYVKVKVLRIDSKCFEIQSSFEMYRFAIAESERRRSAVVEDRCGFFLQCPWAKVCLMIINRIFWNSWRNSLLRL